MLRGVGGGRRLADCWLPALLLLAGSPPQLLGQTGARSALTGNLGITWCVSVCVQVLPFCVHSVGIDL